MTSSVTPAGASLAQHSLPAGFRAYSGSMGVRSGRDDVAIVVSDEGCVGSAVFTKSLFAGPSIELSRDHSAGGRFCAAVIVAGNANVATGAQGTENASELATLAARAAGVPSAGMLVASTGVIGRQYPMELIRSHLSAVNPDDFVADSQQVAEAMMTTDTFAKTSTATAGSARVTGVAKGVGMIEPDMATMLALVMTDAEVDAATLDQMWRSAVEDTFNCLSVDTDTSTSDSAVILASGRFAVDPSDLVAAIRSVCLDLTMQLAADGEGATKLIAVTVSSARDRAQAKLVAKAIVNSPLVKTAVHGADPNWGRVAMAVGKCSDQSDIDPAQVVIRFGELECYPNDPGPAGLERLRELMSEDRVDIEVSLRTGQSSCQVFGCDLSEGYIRINADYTT